MIGIAFSKYIKLIVLIQLTSCFSKIHCRRENHSPEISCNITTPHKNVNGTNNDVRKILAVNRCPKEYQNYDIIKKCENLIGMNMSDTDSALFIPVTNRFNNITYWNKYCAICNEETEFAYWPPWSELDDLDELCVVLAIKELLLALGGVPDADLGKMVSDFIKDGMILISMSKNSTELRCSLKGKWPMNLVQFVAPCLAEGFQYKQEQRLNKCQYFRKSGEICFRMRLIIEGKDFFVDENDKIRIFDRVQNREFTEMTYKVESGIDNVLYMCDKNEIKYGIYQWVEIVLITVSVIFIVFYLFGNFNKKYFENFPSKIIYSYSIGLLVTYLLLMFVYLLFRPSCIVAILTVFSWFFHFFWTMIISLELCRLTYCTIRKRKVTVSPQPKRYVIYCIFGYVLPAVLPIIYFFILETEDNKCPPIPGHFGIPCEPAKNSMAEYMIENLLTIFIGSLFFIIPVLFILQSCVLIYTTKCGPTSIRSTANRNHLIILIKMANIMGANWTLYMLSVLNGKDSLSVLSVVGILQLLTDLQGVFVFFMFGFKKKMLYDILFKFKCKKRNTQESISAGTGTTVHYQSSSGQINHSTTTIE